MPDIRRIVRRLSAPRACALSIVALLFATGVSGAQEGRQLIDGIAAVVGDEVILESEVDEEVYIYQARTGMDVSGAEGADIRAEILREMVDEMLLVAKARRDTVVVEEAELEAELENRVSDLRERHGSDEAFRAALAEEGLTLDELKDLYRDDIERRMLAEKVVRQEVHSNIDVTWGEVEDYYEEHREEVARVPEAYRLAGILISAQPSEEAKRAAFEKLSRAREELEQGVPFEEVAREYSEDASASRGGDLGRIRRGMMVPEFEEAAFSLEPGETSGIVPSRFGFHIIRVEEATDEGIRARHILVRVESRPEDYQRARARAESVRQMALGDADFASLAQEYSDDPNTGGAGGELGWFRTGEMSPSIDEAVSGVEEGGVAPVVEGEGGFYVLKVLEHREEGVAELDEIREDLRDYIYGLKVEEAYSEFMDGLSDEIYVDIRGAETEVADPEALDASTEPGDPEALDAGTEPAEQVTEPGSGLTE
ncbi:MAG: hypothetical protein GF400_03830 [Candidatus Eisenbacteria bacterium]|nr:hypothetical protein [Candidatus Eisenbacteria bacterium]